MNFAFWVLVAILAVGVWFALSLAFKPLGNLLLKIFNKAKTEMRDSENLTNYKEEERHDN